MKLRFNKTQRQSLAKFFYDIAKLCFGGWALATILQGKNVESLAGIVITVIGVLIAIYLEKED